MSKRTKIPFNEGKWEITTNSKSGKSIVCLLAVVLMALLLLSAIPLVWLSLKPAYSVTGAIRVAPVSSDILDGEVNRRAISDYERFMNTQVEMITTNAIVQKVADTLVDRNLSFFQEAESYGLIARLSGAPRLRRLDSPEAILMRAIVADKSIIVTADHRSELIKITMQNEKPREARMIVDTFITAYMENEVVRALEDRNQQSNLLEAQSDTLQTQKDGNRHRPTSISVAYYAKIAAIHDSRVKFTIVITVGVIACGIVLVTLGKANCRSSKSAS
jgi:uncharacterized protein involved in exopolysaccharide biosynthesis